MKAEKKYCRMCGSKLLVESETRDCPDCEEVDVLEKIECSNCVQNLYSMPRTCARCTDFHLWTLQRG